MQRMKFTKREQKKIAVVLDMVASQAQAALKASGSPYNNDFGCGNCGDMGPLFSTLRRVANLVGLDE